MSESLIKDLENLTKKWKSEAEDYSEYHELNGGAEQACDNMRRFVQKILAAQVENLLNNYK